MSTGLDPAVSPLDLADATLAFRRAFDAWVRKASVANAGVSVPRLRLLYELHCNGPRKMADLADGLGVTPRNVTALVDALEAEDQVRRVAHPTDRRVTMVEITGGSAAVDEGMRAFREAVAGLFASVSHEDRMAFARVLRSIGPRISE